MRIPFLYRLLGFGKIPKKVRPILESEEILISDECMNGQFVSKNVIGPGKRRINRREGFSGCLVITKKRVLCYTFLKLQINIAILDPKIKEFIVEMPKKDVLSISFETSLFKDDCEGVVAFQFHTVKAQEFYDTFMFILGKES